MQSLSEVSKAIFAASGSSPLPSASFRSKTDRVANDYRFQKFLDLQAAYRPSGGLVSADDVLAAHRSLGVAQALSRLARWIVNRTVVTIQCDATTWLPLFQFDRSRMSVHPDVAAVTLELCDAFDGPELADWFASPNSLLCHTAPADAIAVRPAAVLAAARLDRFIACG